jgi:hypothetical protein
MMSWNMLPVWHVSTINIGVWLTITCCYYWYPLPFSKKSREMHEISLPQTNSSPNTCTRLLSCTCVHKQRAYKFKTFILIQLREYNLQFISLTWQIYSKEATWWLTYGLCSVFAREIGHIQMYSCTDMQWRTKRGFNPHPPPPQIPKFWRSWAEFPFVVHFVLILL